MRKLYVQLLLYSGICYLNSCSKSFDNEYIQSKSWLFDSGDKCVGDFIKFDSTEYYMLKSDTIWQDGKPRGVITALDTVNGILTIESLDGKKVADWVDLDKAYN